MLVEAPPKSPQNTKVVFWNAGQVLRLRDFSNRFIAVSLTLLRIFFFRPIRFLPCFVQLQNAVNVRLGSQQLLHVLTSLSVLGVCRLFLRHKCSVLGLQTLDGGELLYALVIKKLLRCLMERNFTFMLRKKLLCGWCRRSRQLPVQSHHRFGT